MLRELLNFVEFYAIVIFGFWILMFFLMFFPDKLRELGVIDEKTFKMIKGEIEK